MMEPEKIRECTSRLVTKCKNTLSSLETSNRSEVTSLLQTILYLSHDVPECPGPHLSPELTDLDLPRVRTHFQSHSYAVVLRLVTSQLSVEWISMLSPGDGGVLDAIVLSGPPQLALIELSDTITNTGPGYKVDKCIDWLERLVTLRLGDILWTPCRVVKDQAVDKLLWPVIITYLTSLPDRVTAKHRTQTSEFFYPHKYVAVVSLEIHRTLCQVRNALQEGQSCSVEFLGQILGKLALCGHADLLWESLLPRVESDLLQDCIWSRVCERLINHVPDRCLESLLVPLLQRAAGYETAVKLLGHSVVSNQKLRFLLTNKLVFHRTFPQDKILQNIVGYLSHSTVTMPLLIQMLTSLVDVWGDNSALTHTSYDQHLYLSRAIAVCLAFVDNQDKTKLKQDLLPRLMTGMQCHLGSAVAKVRHLGMTVAECVTATLDPGGEKLVFEHPDDEDTKRLTSLLQKPIRHRPVSPPTVSPATGADVHSENTIVPKNLATETDMEELDSDDDLEPYDLSEDTRATKVKAPVYLRDCMEGLLDTENPERQEVCLMSAEGLIFKLRGSVREIAVEFTKLLLHLQNNLAIPGFLAARHNALVALTVVSPVNVADHLTTEFFARNYNTRQRLDILEVLAGAAQKLSNPSDPPVSDHPPPSPPSPAPDPDSPAPWRHIVERRIQAKTRRFTHGPQGKALQESVSAFGAVAGHFFFPLLSVHERRDGVLDLLGEDHLLLSRLVYTFGVVVYAAHNTPIVRQMSKALLELTWSLRYHTEPSVRQGLLFAVAMTILAVPSYMLFSDLQTEIIDNKSWLEDVVKSDPDTDCQKLAVQCLLLVDKALKQEFHKTETA